MVGIAGKRLKYLAVALLVLGQVFMAALSITTAYICTSEATADACETAIKVLTYGIVASFSASAVLHLYVYRDWIIEGADESFFLFYFLAVIVAVAVVFWISGGGICCSGGICSQSCEEIAIMLYMVILGLLDLVAFLVYVMDKRW